jgi:hypothetical protein
MIAGGGDELLANPWNPLSPADSASPSRAVSADATDGEGSESP